MATRDNPSVVISRQSILLVTAVGVGLLTLVYVLGVQVGKQGSAVRFGTLRTGAGEGLSTLPAPLTDQLKSFDGQAPAKAPEAPAPAAAPAAGGPETKDAPKPAEAKDVPKGPEAKDGKEAPKAEDAKAKPEEAKAKAEEGPHWTLQFVSTPDAKEAQRLAARLKAAGYPAVVVKERSLHKVRLAKGGSRESLEKPYRILKAKGFKPFTIKTD